MAKVKISVDNELIETAFQLSNVNTNHELINQALLEFIERHQRKDIRELRGQIKFLLD